MGARDSCLLRGGNVQSSDAVRAPRRLGNALRVWKLDTLTPWRDGKRNMDRKQKFGNYEATMQANCSVLILIYSITRRERQLITGGLWCCQSFGALGVPTGSSVGAYDSALQTRILQCGYRRDERQAVY